MKIFKNSEMGINDLQELLMSKAFGAFDITDTAIALSINKTLDEIVKAFVYQYDSDYRISPSQYELVVNDLFAYASELLNKY